MQKRNMYERLVNNNNKFNINNKVFNPGINKRITPKPKTNVNQINNIKKKPI